MPRVAGSSQALLMNYGAQRESSYGSSSGGGLGANTSIASQENMMQPKEWYGNFHRGSSNDSTRSTRSTEHPPPSFTRKAPKKTTSLHTGLVHAHPAPIPRIVSDSFTNGRTPDSSPKRPLRRHNNSRFRAAESGKGDVLPFTSATTSQTNNRSRTSSLSGLMPSPFKSAEPRSLRSRRRTINSDDEGSCVIRDVRTQNNNSNNIGMHSHHGHEHRHSWPASSENEDVSFSKGDHRPRQHRSFYSFPAENKFMNMKSSHCVVLILLFCVACFTAGSYRRVFDATTKLELVQREESLLLLHLHKVEDYLIELHENLKRLTDRSDGPMATNTGGSQRLAVDSDLVDVQMRKLREMEAELDHEVRSLQTRLSDSAKRAIVSNFGEGAVQVDLDISFGENDNALVSNTISIRLWYDTPHTAWTFLQQIQNGAWNGAKFSVYHGRALLVQTETGGMVEPQVDFIEHSQRGHDRYTVGLTDSGIILNIQDNRDYFKKEASVGVITSGFDTLRQLVTEVEGSHSESAIIRRASVSHLRKEQNAR